MLVSKFSDSATKEPANVTSQELIQTMKSNSRFHSGVSNLLFDGVYRVNGWAYDMRDELQCYLVKQHGHWQEYYAPNRTTLRRLVSGRIDKIQEVEQEV